jgi:hypothetical protein
MAKVPINDPKHWRERAEETRTVADEMSDPDSKRRMLRIAEDYEELARRAERRLLAASKHTGPIAGFWGSHLAKGRVPELRPCGGLRTGCPTQAAQARDMLAHDTRSHNA